MLEKTQILLLYGILYGKCSSFPLFNKNIKNYRDNA